MRSISSSDPRDFYYEASRPELHKYIPTNYHTVLEVGCGRGGFSDSLSRSAEIWGVEPFSKAAEFAKLKLHRVLIGKYEDVESAIPDDKFDLVICNDVIEHMSDDFWFLTNIRKKLRAGGTLMGSIPNIRYWPILFSLVFNKEWEYQDDGVLDRTHLRFYTIKSFPKMLTHIGYELVIFEGINRIQRLPSIWHRLLLNTSWFADSACMQFAFVAKSSVSDGVL